MPLVLDATSGGSASNSFLTVVEAQNYFDSRLPVAGWDNAISQDVLLVMATRVLTAMARPLKELYPPAGGVSAYYRTAPQWTGAPATSTQRLPWPRTGMFDGNGNAIGVTVVPEDLKFATAELAGYLGGTDSTLDNDVIAQGITSIKAGSVALTFKQMIDQHVLPDFLWNMMPSSWFTDELIDYAFKAFFDVVSADARNL